MPPRGRRQPPRTPKTPRGRWPDTTSAPDIWRARTREGGEWVRTGDPSFSGRASGDEPLYRERDEHRHQQELPEVLPALLLAHANPCAVRRCVLQPGDGRLKLIRGNPGRLRLA